MTERSPLATDLLSSSVRRQVVDLLANLPAERDPNTGARRPAEGLSARDLSDRFGLHVTTMRFHLDQLVAGGLVTSHFKRGEGAGRPRKLYAIAHGSLDSNPTERSFALLSEVLVQSFADTDDRLSPEELGARWGRRRVQDEHFDPSQTKSAETPGQWLGKIGVMVDVLQEWGYVPEVSTTDNGRTARVALHDCPFIDLAKDNTALVCGIHRGLMRGVMHELGEELTEVSLTPFVTPHLCVAALTTTVPFTKANPRPPLLEKETRP